MKEYVLLFRGGDSERQAMSPEEMQAHMGRWLEWRSGMIAKNQFVAGSPLMREGKVLHGKAKKLTDGPFVEGKEIIGGYILLKAADIEDAIKISENCPNLEGDSGTVEVREVRGMYPS